jgi:hypothetical protein
VAFLCEIPRLDHVHSARWISDLCGRHDKPFQSDDPEKVPHPGQLVGVERHRDFVITTIRTVRNVSDREFIDLRSESCGRAAVRLQNIAEIRAAIVTVSGFSYFFEPRENSRYSEIGGLFRTGELSRG